MWLPHNVEAEMVRERQAFDAERSELVARESLRQLESAKRFDRELKDIDPYLELGWIPGVEGREAPPGVVWNRWHVIRHNPAAPDYYEAILDADGGYMEPTSRVLEQVRMSDMNNPQARARWKSRRAREVLDRERDRDRQREVDRAEVAWRLKTVDSPGVSFSDVPWKARAGGRKG